MATTEKTQKEFSSNLLPNKEKEYYNFVKNRIQELQHFRKQPQYGVSLETLWDDADRDYVPHRLKTISADKKIFVEDETKGWRSQPVRLTSEDWQLDVSQINPYVKINVALSILIDQNPTGVFSATAKKFQAVTELIHQLYQRSWEFAKSKQQLKLFVYNLAKYGWACARTYPLRLSNTTRVLVKYDNENPSNNEYEEREVIEYNDIFRENLDPWNVWMDDMAKPNDMFSLRDWTWRKVYAWDVAEQEFGKYKNWQYVKKNSGILTDRVSASKQEQEKKFEETDLIEIYGYENRMKDLLMVLAGGYEGVPIIIEPLPVSDSKGIKKLSLWQTYWTLRHANSPYGIGIYEAIRYEQHLLDRFRNMTLDQLALSIYKMFFYSGTQMLTETGKIVIHPGEGRQVLNPKDITWLDIKGPGQEAWLGLKVLKDDLNEASGITDPLMGEIVGKTAYESAQAKEAALKRLKNPLENILDALETEGYITVSLIQLLYSIPEVIRITDQKLIEDYLNEIQGDEELFERDEEDNFSARVFREFPLNLDKDEEGNLIETEDTRFFHVKPSGLNWEGVISIKAQSILTPSKQLDKALDMEMYNVLIPLIAQPPEIYSKIAKNIVKLYEKDPRDILPDRWLQEIPQAEPLFVPREQVQAEVPTKAPQFTSSPAAPAAEPRSLVGKLVNRVSAPFRKV